MQHRRGRIVERRQTMKKRRSAGIATVALSLIVTGSAFGRPTPGRDPFSECRPRLTQKPDDYESSYCFYAAAFERWLWDEGNRVFEALMLEHPGNFWLPLAYGHLRRNRVPDADLDAAEAIVPALSEWLSGGATRRRRDPRPQQPSRHPRSQGDACRMPRAKLPASSRSARRSPIRCCRLGPGVSRPRIFSKREVISAWPVAF